MGRRRRNKRAIERYITVLQPKLEVQTGGVINLESLGKPESTPPVTDAALVLIHRNQAAASKLEPIFRDMGLAFKDPEPFYLLVTLNLAGLRNGDPGALRRWRAGRTEDDQLLNAAFERALEYVENELEKRYPHQELEVVTDPRDDPVGCKRDAQKIDTAYSDGVIVKMLETIEREEGPMKRNAAVGLLSDREGYSIPRIRKAIENENRRAREAS
jgi:hypothetical protein